MALSGCLYEAIRLSGSLSYNLQVKSAKDRQNRFEFILSNDPLLLKNAVITKNTTFTFLK
jgi:hypothetical protein